MIRNNSQKDISKYVKALAEAGGEVYEVGGPVRDRFLDRTCKDHDLLCRNLTLEQISGILSPYGKVAAVGKLFGVIKFSPHRAPGITLDIALPRKERSTGVGHKDFDVDFDPALPVEADLGRRDFTINAMAIRLKDGELIDFHNGQEDLKNRTLRMVFPKAFEEDPLRLVRAIQFTARLGLTIEPQTWKAMAENAALIKTVSGERIGMEFVKLMKASKPSIGFDLMYECGLMKHIIPELIPLKGIEQDKQPGEDVYDHTMRVLDAARSDSHIEHRGNLELLFAALFHDVGKSRTARYHPPSKRTVFFGHQIASSQMAHRWMRRVKLTACGVDTGLVTKLIENHMFETKASFTDRAIRRFIAKVSKEHIFKLIDLRLSDNRGGKHPYGIKGVLRLRQRIKEEIAKKPPFGTEDLVINGNDVMQLGILEGPAIGRILNALVARALDDPDLNERDKLLALAQEMLENPELMERTQDIESI